MNIRNITFLKQAPAGLVKETEKPAAEVRLKLRSVMVSPHEEYQLREGDVRPISNELHAAILSRKGRAEITPKGIVVDRKDMGGGETHERAPEAQFFGIGNSHLKGGLYGANEVCLGCQLVFVWFGHCGGGLGRN